jgi:hypothetical protein
MTSEISEVSALLSEITSSTHPFSVLTVEGTLLD